ncbi:3-methyl-2-oxobutanoate hydroxymethyltransferase [Escherichia coli]|uniref:3-methyl-2-oxobutanoate hydroxymethyltransferase n=1 Tax=Escherichia coli TaxID=562 RepID=A0A376MSA3_ECOLX|nr:3-methyl-2-oxobutanoate hydroxymethyltransferase [Escherichia coli]
MAGRNRTNADRRAVPVCGHLGLTPQSVNIFGGYKVQGRGDEAADRLLSDALALEAAGAQLLVLECVPVELAKTHYRSTGDPGYRYWRRQRYRWTDPRDARCVRHYWRSYS